MVWTNVTNIKNKYNILAHYRIKILTFEAITEIKYDRGILILLLEDDQCAANEAK